MPSIYGPRLGSAKTCIELEYSQSYNADATGVWTHVNGIVNSTFNITDSTNSWAMSGGLGAASGGATNISHPSSGGRTHFGTVANWTPPGGVDVYARCSPLEGASGGIEFTGHIPCPVMAPYTDGSYIAYNVAPTSFWIGNFIVNDQGYPMIDIAAQISRIGPGSPEWQVNAGAWANFPITGLVRNTTYWYRCAVRNSGYGWGPWGPWKSVTTPKTVPSAPYGYSARDITQTGFTTTGTQVADFGGGTPTNLALRYNTSPSITGEITVIKGSWADITVEGLLPGTKYYFKEVAANEIGWSADGDWVSFTTLPGVLIKDAGVWKNAIPYVKDAGVWKSAIRYVKDAGVWK